MHAFEAASRLQSAGRKAVGGRHPFRHHMAVIGVYQAADKASCKRRMSQRRRLHACVLLSRCTGAGKTRLAVGSFENEPVRTGCQLRMRIAHE